MDGGRERRRRRNGERTATGDDALESERARARARAMRCDAIDRRTHRSTAPRVCRRASRTAGRPRRTGRESGRRRGRGPRSSCSATAPRRTWTIGRDREGQGGSRWRQNHGAIEERRGAVATFAMSKGPRVFSRAGTGRNADAPRDALAERLEVALLDDAGPGSGHCPRDRASAECDLRGVATEFVRKKKPPPDPAGHWSCRRKVVERSPRQIALRVL
jgi:hypothetical protein